VKTASIYFGVVLLCAVSCADRDRSNPLDPENPDTNGKPATIQIFSIQDTVFLEWSQLNLNDLRGYKIQRKTNFQNSFETIAQVDETRDSFQDIVSAFNTQYSYRYSALGETYESEFSGEVEIEPGPTFNWVEDISSRRLFKLTHDARFSISTTVGFSLIRDIAPNPVTGDVWVLDIPAINAGRLFRVNSEGRIIQPLVTLMAPTDISLYKNTGSFWVSDSLSNRVWKFDASGTRLFNVSNLSNPVAVAVDQRNGRCWIVDDGLGQVIRVDANGSGRLASPAQIGDAICCMAVDSRDGAVWIAETSRLIKLDSNGEQLLEIGSPLTQVRDLEVNDNTGEVWIINWSPSMIIKYDATGEQLFQLDEGFFEPEDLSLSLFDNSCLVADTGNSRLVRISTLGNIVRETEVVDLPGILAVDNTQALGR